MKKRKKKSGSKECLLKRQAMGDLKGKGNPGELSYQRARDLALKGQVDQARSYYEELKTRNLEFPLKALLSNDLAALAAETGDMEAARQGFQAALEIDPHCEPARANLTLLEEDRQLAEKTVIGTQELATLAPCEPSRIKIAILSFLFNWPSTGGGIVHTVELARFLEQAGYEVRHFYARHTAWGIGKLEGSLPFPSEPLDFHESNWTVHEIQAQFRRAVAVFDPDHVIITDSWNSKPILAEAVRGYPYILRFQAMECLCPLNNVRLLADENGRFSQCPRNQLATPQICHQCLSKRGQRSGSLHQAERTLCGVGTQEYHDCLIRSIREAEAVLVVNPLTEAMISPYAECVRVVTAGMDPARFPWPPPENQAPKEKMCILFAGLVEETIKGFDVLHEACTQLWKTRQDFELVATGDPPGRLDGFTRFIGWQTQEDLPRHLYAADILAMPTIAQEALGRTAVEAMAAGIPVVASRLGGLPFTVTDGATGLLFEPGDAKDLACKISTLLDDSDLRKRLGHAGRRRFEDYYAWPVIIERHYRPLLTPRRRDPVSPAIYHPFIPEKVDVNILLDEMADYCHISTAALETKLRTYRAFHDSKGYARTLGERKTLCFEEALILYVLLGQLRPQTIVEIGTQDGKSMRRILDVKSLLGLNARVICFGSEVEIRHFQTSEAEFISEDVTTRFANRVLQTYRSGFVFCDVHSFDLLKEIVTETLASPSPWTLAIHDCSRGLCNPRMELAKDDLKVSSLTGIWERYVLAEAFGLADPLSQQLDNLETDTHRLRIFSTPHGLGVIAPKEALGLADEP